MNVPKLHHYLAEAYLKRFTDRHGDLRVLDRRTRIIRRQRPEVTAAGWDHLQQAKTLADYYIRMQSRKAGAPTD